MEQNQHHDHMEHHHAPEKKMSFFEKYQTFFAIIIVGVLILAGLLILAFKNGSQNQGAQQPTSDATETQSQVEAGMVKVVKGLKLDAKKFTMCLDAGTYKNLIASDVALAQASGVQGTPTFFILNRTFNADGSVNKVSQFEILGARDETTFLQSLADKKAPSDQPAQPAGQKIVLSPSDHYEGPANAAVVIVEYSDIECPFCKAEKPVIDDILKNHPEYAFVYRHSPIVSLHPWAEYKAEASECVFAQGGDSAFFKFLDAEVK